MNYKGRVARISLTLALFVLVAQVPFSVQAADLNDLLKQKDQLSQDLDKNQSAAQNKENEANSLSRQINNLTSDISSTEKKIGETGTQIGEKENSIAQLNTNIEQKKAELASLKKKLNSALVELYRSSDRSDMQLLFGSDSLGSASNEAKYLQSIETQVKYIFTKVDGIKKDLEKNKSDEEAKKAELDQLKNQQVAYMKGIEYQKGQKDKMLGMTLEQKISYEQQVEKLKSEISSVSSAIYAERQRRLSGGKEQLGGGGSGYPYSSIDEPDAWGFLTRECTSYAAWNFNVIQGKKFINTRPGQGSAYNWPNLARDQGYSVSGTPRVGALISWDAGSLTSGWGHVAIVEKVNSDGTIDLSEYNWIKYSYSYRKYVKPGDYGSYSYIY